MTTLIEYAGNVQVFPGPGLLAGVDEGPSLAAHRRRHGDLPRLRAEDLLALVESGAVRGRGGAAFPFAIKMRTALEAGRRREVVVNASEGEPASAKDSALALTQPHLVLDGARAVAAAFGSRQVHVVVPGERPEVGRAWQQAMAERPDRFVLHETAGGFVGGQARAVLELMAGRRNLPVTSWQREAVAGHRQRPTLLSNAETWAHLGLLALHGSQALRGLGTAAEPGTTLITWNGTQVHEVEYGASLADHVPLGDRPVLVGGFHGTWAHGRDLATRPVSVTGFREAGHPLGAGVLLAPDSCPVDYTAAVVDYLAGQSAQRCGPCFNGLPALADALGSLASGTGRAGDVEALTSVVSGRGACAHPDGTARLASSLLARFPDEVAAHAAGHCRGRS